MSSSTVKYVITSNYYVMGTYSHPSPKTLNWFI